MIIESTLNDLDKLLDFSWQIQSCTESSSYPMYKNKDELRTAMIKRLNHKDDKLLAFYENDRLLSVMLLLVEKKSHYLQTTGIYVNKDEPYVYTEFLEYLKKNYKGFEMFFGYPKENEKAVQIMRGINAKVVDSSVSLYLVPEDFTVYRTDMSIEELESESFDDFAAFHDKYNPDMYWTSARIIEDIAKWKIFTIRKENRIIGSILYGVWNKDEAEIYSVTVDMACRENELYSALLSKTIPVIFDLNKQGILYMIDDNALMEMDAALRVGFKTIGSYQSFKVIL